jgi:hypothetical protein
MDTNNAAQANDQECGPMSEPTEQHKWLQQFVGEWTVESTMMMPDGSSMTGTGRETVTTLGELWVIGAMTAGMPGGGEMQSRLTLGFNSAKGKFEGTFIATMMDMQWVYEGSLSGNVLTLDCVGPNMMPGVEPGTMANYQDIYEVVDSNTRKLRSQAQTPDGWLQFMEATYKRV